RSACSACGRGPDPSRGQHAAQLRRDTGPGSSSPVPAAIGARLDRQHPTAIRCAWCTVWMIAHRYPKPATMRDGFIQAVCPARLESAIAEALSLALIEQALLKLRELGAPLSAHVRNDLGEQRG